MIDVKFEALFPVPIQITTLDNLLTQEHIDYCDSLNNKDRRSNIGNWRSQSSCILDDPKLVKIKEFVDRSIESYKHNILSNTDIDVYVTQSWLNFSSQGQWHHQHAHPNSFISGVFYVQTTAEDKITFHCPWDMHILKVTPKTPGVLNSLSWWYPTVQGSLILFPSKLQHHVDPVTSSSTRISLSFNTFVRGDIGVESDSTQLILK